MHNEQEWRKYPKLLNGQPRYRIRRKKIYRRSEKPKGKAVFQETVPFFIPVDDNAELESYSLFDAAYRDGKPLFLQLADAAKEAKNQNALDKALLEFTHEYGLWETGAPAVDTMKKKPSYKQEWPDYVENSVATLREEAVLFAVLIDLKKMIDTNDAERLKAAFIPTETSLDSCLLARKKFRLGTRSKNFLEVSMGYQEIFSEGVRETLAWTLNNGRDIALHSIDALQKHFGVPMQRAFLSPEDYLRDARIILDYFVLDRTTCWSASVSLKTVDGDGTEGPKLETFVKYPTLLTVAWFEFAAYVAGWEVMVDFGRVRKHIRYVTCWRCQATGIYPNDAWGKVDFEERYYHHACENKIYQRKLRRSRNEVLS